VKRYDGAGYADIGTLKHHSIYTISSCILHSAWVQIHARSLRPLRDPLHRPGPSDTSRRCSCGRALEHLGARSTRMNASCLRVRNSLLRWPAPANVTELYLGATCAVVAPLRCRNNRVDMQGSPHKSGNLALLHLKFCLQYCNGSDTSSSRRPLRDVSV
jgi:hypothetical protein